jgi:hypothetical protein
VRSWRERSTAARFLIGWLKVRITGIPTPKVWPYPSSIWVLNVCAGARVRNEVVLVTVRPEAFTAAAVTA